MRHTTKSWHLASLCLWTSVNLGFRSELLQLGFFYTNADNLSCRQKRYPTATKRTELCSHNIQWSKHTSSILPGWLAGEVWCIKSQSFTFIYVRPSGFQSPLLLIYFLMVYTNIISHAAVFVSRQKRLCMTLKLGVAKNRSDVWRSTFTMGVAWRSFAPLQKLRWNHRSHMWTEALSGRVFLAEQELSGNPV